MKKDGTLKLTDKKMAFAQNVGKHLMNMTQAAREAGYVEPNIEMARLMRDPAVLSKIIGYLRSSAIKWQVLVGKSKKVLADAMDARMTLRTRSGEAIGEVDDIKTRLEAARTVLMALKRDGQHLLEDAAAEEDAASQSTIDLAKAVLGEAEAIDVLPEIPEPPALPPPSPTPIQ